MISCFGTSLIKQRCHRHSYMVSGISWGLKDVLETKEMPFLTVEYAVLVNIDTRAGVLNPRFSHSKGAQEWISQSSKTNAYVHENVLRLLIKEESIATQKRREKTALTHLACGGEVGDGDQEREATTRGQERHVYIAKLAFAKVRGSVAFRRQLVHALCNGPRPSYIFWWHWMWDDF